MPTRKNSDFNTLKKTNICGMYFSSLAKVHSSAYAKIYILCYIRPFNDCIFIIIRCDVLHKKSRNERKNTQNISKNEMLKFSVGN